LARIFPKIIRCRWLLLLCRLPPVSRIVTPRAALFDANRLLFRLRSKTAAVIGDS
jgi:hypothetical protein